MRTRTTPPLFLGLLALLAVLVAGLLFNWTPNVEAAFQTPHTQHVSVSYRVPENPLHPFGTCASSWKYHGEHVQWFNSNQIEEHVKVAFELAADGTFCGGVNGVGDITCHFGCTGTQGFIDLYYCNNSSCTSNSRVGHTQYPFTGCCFVDVSAPTYYNGNAYQLYQAYTGVPCYGSGCWWYTTSAIVNSVSA